MNHVPGYTLREFAVGEPMRVWSLLVQNPCLTWYMSDTSTPILEARVLASTDRCDRCGAQAYVLAELPGGSVLLFCGHHWNAHEVALRPKLVKVVDELHHLYEGSQSK